MDLLSSTVALGAASGISDDYWFSLHWNNNNSQFKLEYLDVDSSGNIVLTGNSQQSDLYGTLPNNHKATAHKLDGTDGSSIWHRFASHQTTYKNSYYFQITSDDSDNVYINGMRPSIASGSDAGNQSMAILKFNSSGSLQWQLDNEASKGSGWSWSASAIITTSNGTVSCGTDYRSRQSIRLVNISPTGSLQGDRTYEYPSIGLDVSIRPNLKQGSTDDYYYVTGATSNNKNFVAQIRDNWSWRGLTLFTSPSGELHSQGLALDSSDNQYVVAGNESPRRFLYKILRSNQQVTWQKNISSLFEDYRYIDLVCKDGKIYVIGTQTFNINSYNQECIVVIAFNQSDGSIDSAIRIRNNVNRNARGRNITATDTALVFTGEVTITSSSKNASGTFKIPPDFSLTGSYAFPGYDTIVYEAYTPTGLSTSTQTTNTEFLSATVANHSKLSNGNYTIYNVSFTEAQKDID